MFCFIHLKWFFIPNYKKIEKNKWFLQKIINKINGTLKFLYRKTRYLTKELGRMLFNALIQSHLDYACSAWYPNLNEKAKKIQIM